jgi:esterase/lipase
MFFNKKAVLLIHGFVGGIYDFGNFQNELQTIRKFDVFTFTLPGHEKMTVKDVKYNEWIDEGRKQVEFLLSKGYHTIYIVGHSMGGVIAAYLASVYPEVKKLVLAAPAFRYFAFDDGKLNVKGFNETLKNIPELLKDEGQDKVIERIRKTPLTTMLEFTNLVNKYQDCLANVTCPVLTIHGLKDKVVPASATKLVHDKVASRTNILVNIKNVPHDCFIKERNNEVKKLIRDFLVNRNHKEKKFIEM